MVRQNQRPPPGGRGGGPPGAPPPPPEVHSFFSNVRTFLEANVLYSPPPEGQNSTFARPPGTPDTNTAVIMFQFVVEPPVASVLWHQEKKTSTKVVHGLYFSQVKQVLCACTSCWSTQNIKQECLSSCCSSFLCMPYSSPATSRERMASSSFMSGSSLRQGLKVLPRVDGWGLVSIFSF